MQDKEEHADQKPPIDRKPASGEFQGKMSSYRVLLYEGTHDSVEAFVGALTEELPAPWEVFTPQGPEARFILPHRYLCFEKHSSSDEVYTFHLLVKNEKASIEAIKPRVADSVEEPQYSQLIREFATLADPVAKRLGMKITHNALNSN